MKKRILVAITALSLGMAAANAQAATTHNASSAQQGDQFNFMRGGGG
jgi:hypothetical protein